MESYSELFHEAFNLFKEGNYNAAIEKLNEIEGSAGTDSTFSELDFHILRGSVYLALNDTDNARGDFEEALKLDSTSAEACVGLGKVLYAYRKPNEAKIMFEWAVRNEPENEAAKLNLLSINRVLGLDDDHVTPEDEQQDGEPKVDFTNLFNYAYDKFLKDDYETSLENVELLESKFFEEVSLLRGNIYLARNELDKAKEYFKKVLETNNKSTDAYNGLGQVYTAKELYEDAKLMYESALKFNPENQFASVGLAEANSELGYTPIHTFINFFTNEKLNEEFREELEVAFGHFQNKDYEKSIAKLVEIEETIKHSSNMEFKQPLSSILNFMGFNYLALEDYDNAHTCFENALTINPNSSQACAGIGELFFITGRDREAKIMFEWAVKNNPKNRLANAGLAKVNEHLDYPVDHNALHLGIPDEINKEFNDILTEAYEQFNNKDYRYTLEKLEEAEKLLNDHIDELSDEMSLSSIGNFKGFCYLALGNRDVAKEHFEKALEINPKSTQACTGLGELLFLEEKDEEAKRMFEYGVKYGPKNKLAVEGLKKVNKNLDLPDMHNSLVSDEKNTNTEKIGELIEEAYTEFNEKNFKEAVNKLDKAEELIYDNFTEHESYETLTRLNNFKGFNLISLGSKNNARSCFEKALSYMPNSSQACAGLGELFFLDGKDQEAKQMYEWAVKNNPQNVYAVKGLEKVNTNLGLEPEDNSLMETV